MIGRSSHLCENSIPTIFNFHVNQQPNGRNEFLFQAIPQPPIKRLFGDVSMPSRGCLRPGHVTTAFPILSFSPSRQSSDSTRVKGSPRGTECILLRLPLFSTNKTLAICSESSVLTGLLLLPTQVIPCHPGGKGCPTCIFSHIACIHLDKPLSQEGSH